MNTIQKTTIIATAALALGAWGTVGAQEQTGEGQQIAVQQRQQTLVQQQQKTTVQQRTMTGDPIGEQTPAAAKGHTRQLGPGDGAGNQGVPPSDGTGFGSPGRFGTGADQDATGKAGTTPPGKRVGVTSPGAGAGALQRRAGSLTGGGLGGTMCDGSRRHSAMGAAGLGGFGRPRGGHR